MLVGQEDNILRQTNVIVVLTKRNKELVAERKKLEELVHAKTLVAEAEVKRAEKLQHQLDLERNKAVRDRTKIDGQMVELQKQKAQVDENVRELQRKLEYMSRVRLALEHQVSGLREKLDSLMVDYSDVVTAMCVCLHVCLCAGADEPELTTSPNDLTRTRLDPLGRLERKSKTRMLRNRMMVKQARLTLEYETWVTKKKEEANHMYPGMAGAARSRKGTKDPHHAADKDAKGAAAAEEKKQAAEAAAERKRREAEEEEARQKKEAEELARLQKEAEEREKERQRLAEEELAKQQAEEEARAAQEAAEREAAEKAKGGKKKKK
ncbi:hypothetical protein BCR44DRAFT_36266 [Catenaria anguillulae PL171]|uniref:Uncharacterized protein n=1 Tax=Catenaria anguillulae PL171 TaxID=765915 RepID=A0A1Y2HS27_9FUNG|nr:hypothetical protein BCR44DRAFT_36266 [Catenaria anguillulae PL171]